MKKIILILFFLLFVPSLSYSQPSISFGTLKHDFGAISLDEVEYIFEFVNNGDQDLVIEKLTAS